MIDWLANLFPIYNNKPKHKNIILHATNIKVFNWFMDLLNLIWSRVKETKKLVFVIEYNWISIICVWERKKNSIFINDFIN